MNKKIISLSNHFIKNTHIEQHSRQGAPGTFSEYRLPQLQPAKATRFWRSTHITVKTVEMALALLLNVGELANCLRDHPEIEMSVKEKELSRYSADQLLDMSADTMSNYRPKMKPTNFPYSEKFHVSVSANPDFRYIHSAGNLRIEVKSTRAFELPDNIDFNNVNENEYGLPLAINPYEISSAVISEREEKKSLLSLLGLFGNRDAEDTYDSSEKRMIFNWSDNHEEVAIQVASVKNSYVLVYRWDNATRTYIVDSDRV